MNNAFPDKERPKSVKFYKLTAKPNKIADRTIMCRYVKSPISDYT